MCDCVMYVCMHVCAVPLIEGLYYEVPATRGKKKREILRFCVVHLWHKQKANICSAFSSMFVFYLSIYYLLSGAGPPPPPHTEGRDVVVGFFIFKLFI